MTFVRAEPRRRRGSTLAPDRPRSRRCQPSSAHWRRTCAIGPFRCVGRSLPELSSGPDCLDPAAAPPAETNASSDRRSPQLGARRRDVGTIGDGRVQSRIRRFEILLHQERRRVIGRAGIVETVGRAIGRKLILDADVDAEQVAHGILALDAIQPAQDHSPLTGPVVGRDRGPGFLPTLGFSPTELLATSGPRPRSDRAGRPDRRHVRSVHRRSPASVA
jgi:hypothetical protein